MMNVISRVFLFGFIFQIVLGTLVYATDWTHYQGPLLNGSSQESGFTYSSLKPIWTGNVQTGCSSLSVADGMVFTMGNQNDQDTVFALDAKTGKEVWKKTYPCKLNPKMYKGGPNATPTIDGDKVYTFSREGEVYCFEAKTGKVVWQLNVSKVFGAKAPGFGFSSSPLILGEKLILNAGVSGIALDKTNGEKIWASPGDGGYTTPIPYVGSDKKTVLVMISKKNIFGVDLESGDVKWTKKWKTQYGWTAADPLIIDGHVFASTPYKNGAGLYKLGNDKITEVWGSKEFQNCFNSSVHKAGFIYGFHGKNGARATFRCVEAKTGKVKWQAKTGFGTVRLVDGKLVLLIESGELIVAACDSASFKEIKREKILSGQCWAAPAISSGHLYARTTDKGQVVCISLK